MGQASIRMAQWHSLMIVRALCIFMLGTAAAATFAIEPEIQTEQVVIKFTDNLLLLTPTVEDGYIHLSTAQGQVVITQFQGVLLLEHTIAVSSHLRALEGPYIATVVAGQLTAVQIPAQDPSPYIDYLNRPAGLAELAGEHATAWFPAAHKTALCGMQTQLHQRYQGEVPYDWDTSCGSVFEWGFDRDMDMPQAWGITTGSPDVLVAIMDVGFDWMDPELGGDGPPFACTADESLLYYNNGVIYTNTLESLGDANNDGRAGIALVDDDGDGAVDEDSLGRDYRNEAESDVFLGTADALDQFTLYDEGANWGVNDLVGYWLYIQKGSTTGTRVAIISNTADSITTEPVYDDLCPPDTTCRRELLIAHIKPGGTYRVGDGLNNNESWPDTEIDDEGWHNDLPNDDDENGVADDFHGYDFVNVGSGGCANEDYAIHDNNVFSHYSHGTAVAGMLATSVDHGKIMAVAPNVRILPIRIGYGSVLPATGTCEGPGSVNMDLIDEAVEYAMSFHPDIIVTAMGQGWAPEDRVPAIEAMQDAINKGVVFVNSAGNIDTDLVNPWNAVSPVVLVAGLNPNGSKWEDSSYGSWVTVSARGTALTVLRTYLNGVHGYDSWSGTSLSSPIVGGVAALVKSAYPHMQRDDIIWMVKRGVDNIYPANPLYIGQLGTGRVNAYKALTLYGNVVGASTDTSWTNDLWIGGDVLVPAGRTLTLTPGTTVHVATDDLLSPGAYLNQVEFVVNGTLRINGTPSAPVIFKLHTENGPSTEYAVETVVEGSTFTMTTLPAQFAIDARYPIAAASSDTTTVFAVALESSAAIDSVKVDLAGLDASGEVALRDDGEGEDSIAGDGVYTSSRFQANVSVGTREVSLLSWVDGGAIAQQDVSVEVVASKAKFIDVSASTGDLYSLAPADTAATPYASVYFNTAPGDTSGVNLLVVTIDDQGTEPLLMRNLYPTEDGAPGYRDRIGPLLATTIPTGSRGMCFADFDNDGDNDFFVCGVDSSVLYENRLSQAEGKFVNVTGAYFGSHKGDLTGGIAASWGDYNRDGFVDLFVATTNYDGSVRNLEDPSVQQYSTMVFRNQGGISFGQTSFGDAESGNVCLSGCWADLDSDRDLDLVTVQMGGEYPTVLENAGFSYQAGDAELQANVWDTTGEANGANSVTVIDYDHDEYPDLLVTEVAAPGRAVILQNNFDGSPLSKSFTPVELASGQTWNGAVVSDFDLNGQEDYVLLPKSGEAALYMADSYSTSPEYRDLGYTLGLRAGLTSGAIAGDFNNDHDPDLYLGRLKAEQFQYKNVRQNTQSNDPPDAQQKWLEVELRTKGSSSGGLIGAEVTVAAAGRRWTQYVDGGSGRGGQRPGRLLFGLGDIAEEEVSLRVRYPSGEVDSTSVAVNETYSWIEDESVALKAGTRQDLEPDFEFDLQPGTMNWIFRWRSIKVKGDLREDVVHVENFLGYPLGSECSLGIDPNAAFDLSWGDPGVSHSVYWDGTFWQHEVRWFGLPCATSCNHRFWVTSSSGNGSYATSGLRATTSTNFCLPDGEILEQ